MNITLAIPKGKDYKKKIEHELAVARNIKSKQTRDSVVEGLTKILSNYSDGKSYLWNGKELIVNDYPLNTVIYTCGKEFIAPEKPTNSKYLLIVLDANECTIGLLQDKSIQKLKHMTSNVPRKHDAGGQSQRRFEREREHCLKIWLKEIAIELRKMM